MSASAAPEPAPGPAPHTPDASPVPSTVPSTSDDGSQELADVASAFAVRGELTAQLAQVHDHPFDETAHRRLVRFLKSRRLADGAAAAARLDWGA